MAERSWIEEEEQIDVDVGSCCSDSRSVAEVPVSKKFDEASSSGMLKLNEEGDEYILLKHRFYLSVGALTQNCMVVDAYRNLHSSPIKRAQLEAFRMFMEAMAAKCDGNPNVVHAWYGAMKDEVHQIMKDGFRVYGMPRESAHYGFGLHLCPERSLVTAFCQHQVMQDILWFVASSWEVLKRSFLVRCNLVLVLKILILVWIISNLHRSTLSGIQMSRLISYLFMRFL